MKPPPFRPFLECCLLFGAVVFASVGALLLRGSRIDSGEFILGALSCWFGAMLAAFGVLEMVYRWREWRMEHGEDAPVDHAPPPDPDADADAQSEKRLRRLEHARRYLPHPRPDGWSTPMAIDGTNYWALRTDREGIAVQFQRRGSLGVVDVAIVARGGTELATDERCAEILTHLRYVGEWVEAVRDPERPATRRWVGFPEDRLPRWNAPARPPAPARVGPAVKLTQPQLQARRYLPEKLPEGWTLPIAVEDGDGMWMFEFEVRCILVFVGFVDEGGRVMLAVTLLGENDDLDEVDALLLLKHFRGISDFVPVVQEEQVPGQRVFLGTLKTGSGDYASVNQVFGAKSGREKALN